jgi:2-haloacid dehalogenase
MISVGALFFDVFGTLVDWRAGVAREAERILQPLGYRLDWLAFADAWRDEYQPAMEEVRAGQIPFCKLDLLHRRNLDRILPRFGISGLGEDAARELNLAWHRLDAWPDAPHGLARLKRRFVLAPVSNGNISLMVDLARRNGFPWDAVLGAETAGDPGCTRRISRGPMSADPEKAKPNRTRRWMSLLPSWRIWPFGSARERRLITL